jgi:hypothetical protein
VSVIVAIRDDRGVEVDAAAEPVVLPVKITANATRMRVATSTPKNRAFEPSELLLCCLCSPTCITPTLAT